MPDINIDNFIIPKPKKGNLSDLLLKESDLQGHLEVKKTSKKKDGGKKNDVPLMSLIINYMKNEALSILKSLYVSNIAS